MVERGGAQTDEHLARARARDRARPRSAEPRARRPRGSELPSSGAQSPICRVNSWPGWGRSSGSTWSGRLRPRPTRRPSGTSASGAPAGSSRTCASRWRGPRSRAIPRRCSRARARSSRRRSATGREGEEPPPGHGRLPRYTWWDAYAALRERLDELGRRLGGEYRVLVDANQHVDREAAVALGSRLLRQEHDADHAPPRLVGRARDARHRPPSSSRRRRSTRTAAPARSASTPARPTRSTSRACSTRRAASRTGRSRPTPIPEEYPRGARRPRLRLRHLPGRLPVEPRRREAAGGGDAPAGAEPHVSLVDWLEAGRRGAAAALRPPVRPAQRPALPAPQRARRARQRRRRAGAGRALRGGRRPAPARARRVGARADPGARVTAADRLRDVERWIGVGAARRRSVRDLPGRVRQRLPARLRGLGVDHDRVFAVGALVVSLRSAAATGREPAQMRLGLAALAFDFAVVSAYVLVYSFETGLAHPAAHVPAARRGGAALRDPRARSPSRPRALRCSPVFEWLRADRFAPHRYHVDYVTLQLGIELLMGLIVGWLVLRLLGQSTVAETRARRGRAAARPARPARRRARGRQPLRPGAQLLARARPGLRRVHPRGARPAAVRPDRDRAQRGRRRAGDGRRRRGRRRTCCRRARAGRSTGRCSRSCCARTRRSTGAT